MLHCVRITRWRKRDKTLAVVGLGYVGLPLAVEAALKGYAVTGIDINTNLLKTIDARRSPYAHDTRFEKAIAKVPPIPNWLPQLTILLFRMCLL